MKYEKHLYKVNDRVVIKLDNTAKNCLNKGRNNMTIINEQVLGKLEDFRSAEEKIKMTVEEKKEFDELKRTCVTVGSALSQASGRPDKKFENLRKRLCESSLGRNNEAQIEFTKAWEKPSRIEVIEPEKHVIKVGDQYLYFPQSISKKYGKEFSFEYDANNIKLTLEEVKEAEKQLGIQGLQTKWHKAAKKEI